MKINELINIIKLETVTEIFNPGDDVTGAYTSDLLSDVISNTKKGYIWITLQTHINIIAVASLKELGGIIIVMNRELDSDVYDKAMEEKISIFRTDLNAFQISGKLYELGIK